MYDPTYEYILPVNMDLGFPQVVFTEIAGKFFGFTYRFNSFDDSLILKWVTGGGRVVFLGKVTTSYTYEIKDPDYGQMCFLLVPSSTDKKNVTLCLFTAWAS